MSHLLIGICIAIVVNPITDLILLEKYWIASSQSKLLLLKESGCTQEYTEYVLPSVIIETGQLPLHSLFLSHQLVDHNCYQYHRKSHQHLD